MAIKFNHIGIPVKNIMPGMIYFENAKTWKTEPDSNPFAIEYLYFEDGAPYPDFMKKNSHICYDVDDMAPYLAEGDEILRSPRPTADGKQWCAFFMKNGTLIELYCKNEPKG